MSTTLKWILIIGVGLLAVWYFFIRKKPATGSTTTDTTKSTYTQVAPIDKTGCDSTGKDKDGKPCTFTPSVLVITSADLFNEKKNAKRLVATELSKFINKGAIKIESVSGSNPINDILGYDAFPNEKKTLVVKYTVDGVAGEKTFLDNTSIIIP